ncbi:MAG: DUF3828 domain-containing protein [Bacteroidetes bacterium]|nr:DUF3828 domain-containing protein [Bacteroidota bacterium]
MRKRRSFLLSGITLLSIFFFTACSSGTDAQSMDSLKVFYQSYIRESSKVPEDHAKIESLKAKHCTAKFLVQIADAELDADPFLNAQDVEEKWAENLEITPESAAKDQYKVCYTASFDNSKHCVKVTMVDEGGSWKIDNIFK